MTVKTVIANAGNHPDDKIGVVVGHTNKWLMRGETLVLYDGDFTVQTIHHGAGAGCGHDALVVPVQGSGADLVRTRFNPSDSSDVDQLKALAAAFINKIEHSGKDPRLTALAKTAAEEAAMWAVKSATAER